MALPDSSDAAAPTAIRRTLLELQWPEPLVEQAITVARDFPTAFQSAPNSTTELFVELISAAWIVVRGGPTPLA
eukprot:2051481-Lingulodinium_polyedra.AAC.1